MGLKDSGQHCEARMLLARGEFGRVSRCDEEPVAGLLAALAANLPFGEYCNAEFFKIQRTIRECL